METGDLKNNLGKFLKLVRQMKLTKEEDSAQKLLCGDPTAYLPILHQAFLHYSLPLSKWLAEQGYELYGRNDLRFVESMYRVLRDVFAYKPPLTKEKFLSNGFAERKMIMSTRILELCREKHGKLTRGNAKRKTCRGRYAQSSQGSSNTVKYRKPQKVDPEIFTVHGSSHGFSVWEETQQEVRLETPFSSREARSNPQFQILQTTPPPSPRRCVPLPQFMGQISPCKQSTVVRNQRKLLTDLDITPAVTPIKTSIRVEREQLLPPLASSSTSSQSHLGEESCRTPSPEPITQNDSNVTHSTTSVNPPTQVTQDTSEPVQSRTTSSGVGQPDTASSNNVALVQQIRELTDCIGKMSARIVLLETQLQINERKGESEHGLHKDDGPTRAPLKENADPESEILPCSTIRSDLVQRVETSRQHVTPVQSTSVRQPHQGETDSESESTDPSSDDPTPTEMDDSNFRSDVCSGDPVSSEALIAQLRNRTHNTRQLFHSALTTRSSVYT